MNNNNNNNNNKRTFDQFTNDKKDEQQQQQEQQEEDLLDPKKKKIKTQEEKEKASVEKSLKSFITKTIKLNPEKDIKEIAAYVTEIVYKTKEKIDKEEKLLVPHHIESLLFKCANDYRKKDILPKDTNNLKEFISSQTIKSYPSLTNEKFNKAYEQVVTDIDNDVKMEYYSCFIHNFDLIVEGLNEEKQEKKEIEIPQENKKKKKKKKPIYIKTKDDQRYEVIRQSFYGLLNLIVSKRSLAHFTSLEKWSMRYLEKMNLNDISGPEFERIFKKALRRMKKKGKGPDMKKVEQGILLERLEKEEEESSSSSSSSDNDSDMENCIIID